MANERRKPKLLGWVLFVAASAMMLIIASAMIHYAPATYTVTAVDEVGAVLPYALFVGIVTYYLIKPRKIEKPEVRELGKSILRANAVALAISLGALVGVLLFAFIFFPFPLLGGTGGGLPDRPSMDVNLLDLPILNPVFLLTVVVLAVLVGAVVVFTFMRARVETPVEMPDEDTGIKGAGSAIGSTVDDEYRRAIITKYVDGREIMVTRGAVLRSSTTPREFEENVMEVSKAASADFVPLTRLFEEARFSVHRVGEPEKSRAQEHYEKLLKKKAGSKNID